MRYGGHFTTAIFCILVFLGCSNSHNPIVPENDQLREPSSGHQLWTCLDFTYDDADGTLNIMENRSTAKHYNLTPVLPPGAVSISVISWDPIEKILTIEVTLDNPYNVTGFDVRGILTNMGNKKLLNADDYTRLFDTNIPKVPNPFRAFAKDEENRTFWGAQFPVEGHKKTETYEIYFPGPISASYLITACYPDNCPEPYDIVTIQTDGEITDSGGSLDVTVEVLDWQDVTADHVTIVANAVTGIDVPMTPLDPTHWTATLTNDVGAPAGEYEVWVAAYDAVFDEALYNKFIIEVTEFVNLPPVIQSGVDGKSTPEPDSVEIYTVDATDPDDDTLTYSWVLTDEFALPVLADPSDLTGSFSIDWNSLGVALGDEFDLDCAVSDGFNPPVDATTLHITITHMEPGIWSDPILVSGDPGVDEILPRIVYRSNEIWIVYTDGLGAVARVSSDGATFSPPMAIGEYAGIDTLHAVLGGDNGIYVQYQHSFSKETWHNKYSEGSWGTSSRNNTMGITSNNFAADLGISDIGIIFDMWNGDWSQHGFHSDSPYDLDGTWTFDNIQAMYNAQYSMNDGFVQRVEVPKLFYVHDGTTLDYGEFSSDAWSKGAAWTQPGTIIEPGVAPESDGPYHLVVGVENAGVYDVRYLKFDSWPPSSPASTDLATGLIGTPTFHSISSNGDQISVLYDADGEIVYKISSDGGTSFGPPEVLAGSTDGDPAKNSHIREISTTNSTIAAYALMEDGDYNIYIRTRSSL